MDCNKDGSSKLSPEILGGQKPSNQSFLTGLPAISMTVAILLMSGCASNKSIENAAIEFAANKDEISRIGRQKLAEEAEWARKQSEKIAKEEKDRSTLIQARRRQRLAAEEFQVRAGGESGGGGGGDGH